MSDIQQPELVVNDELSLLDKFKKSIRKPRKEQVATFAVITTVTTACVAAGAYIGASAMNAAWNAEVKRVIEAGEAAKAATEDMSTPA